MVEGTLHDFISYSIQSTFTSRRWNGCIRIRDYFSEWNIISATNAGKGTGPNGFPQKLFTPEIRLGCFFANQINALWIVVEAADFRQCIWSVLHKRKFRQKENDAKFRVIHHCKIQKERSPPCMNSIIDIILCCYRRLLSPAGRLTNIKLLIITHNQILHKIITGHVHMSI